MRMKGIWKHLFFIERVLALIGSRLYGSSEDFKKAVLDNPVAREDDGQMCDDMFEH